MCYRSRHQIKQMFFCQTLSNKPNWEQQGFPFYYFPSFRPLRLTEDQSNPEVSELASSWPVAVATVTSWNV